MSSAVTLDPAVAPAPSSHGEEPLYEIVYGKRVELPPMSIYSVRIASELHTDMNLVARQQKLGIVVSEALFILDAERDLRRRPDIAFVSAERWPLDRDLPVEGDWEVVPDLAVEVVSPHDLYRALMTKLREYFDVGVRQVWVVVPSEVPSERQVHVFDSLTQVRILTERDELDGGALLPGFRLPVATLFQRRAVTT